MFKTIKSKLLAIMLSFVIVTFATSIILFHNFVKDKDALASIARKTENTHVLLLKDIKVMHGFFENETIDPEFFQTGKSESIAAHTALCNQVVLEFRSLGRLQEQNGFLLGDSITNLEMNFSGYTEMVDNMISQILKRGFKDYGIEGKMRKYAHMLENQAGDIGMINILQLRRHEKDFIIRQEDQYIKKHNVLLVSIQNAVASDKKLSDARKTELNILLNNYSDEFINLVVLEKKLGLRNYGGLKKIIDERSGGIETSLSALVKVSRDKVQSAIIGTELLYLGIGCVFVLLSAAFAVIISKRITSSISDLKVKIEQFVESDFMSRNIIPVEDPASEIDILITNVSLMEQHIVRQMTMLKQSNKDLEMLFYATSQDIRSPLIMIKRLADLGVSKTTDENALVYFGMIKESWESLNNIVDELGMVTNIRNGEIKTERLELEPLIKTVISEFRPAKGFDDFVFSIRLGQKNEFYSSSGLLRTILRNLIENSMKYSKENSKNNFLRISVVDHNDDMLRIEIADNGIGIKKEHQDKIFEMFFRGTNCAGGTGLGLYIVKCSLEKLNGAISVESDENQGSVFTILLPNNSKLKGEKKKTPQKAATYSLSRAVA